MRQEELFDQIAKIIDEWVPQIKKTAVESLKVRNPKGFHNSELNLLGIGRKMAGEIVGVVLGAIVSDRQWATQQVELFKGSKRMRVVDMRLVEIQTLSGIPVTVEAAYLAPKKKKTKKRGKKQQRRMGTGIFPVLAALGIMFKCSPALSSDVSRQVVESSSVEEARQNLARRGVDLNIKKVWNISRAFATRSLDATNHYLANATDAEGEFSGQRVVACVDGGRIRTRVANKRGKIPKGKKRRRFKTPWREPKLLIIYVINEHGERDQRFLPTIDGTFGDADCVFTLLIGYLRLLGVRHAAQLVISADGARWIWERVSDVIDGVGIDANKVTSIVDFYHAVEHLHKIMELKPGWSKRKRKQWETKNRRLLRRGKINNVIAAIAPLVCGRKAKELRTELNYFAKNKSRMQYATFKKRHFPLGSGAIESCVRRVVNLRMKGPGIFWKEENAEGFLHLRSYFKSGRWDEMLMRILDFNAIPATC